MTETETKIAAAQESVAKAAALLLEHAEGLAMLAMMERRREPPGPTTLSLKDAGGPVTIRNWTAERAWSLAALAAASFAGRFEAFQQVRDPVFLSRREIELREAVEDLVGPRGGPPPPLAKMPATVGRAGITPRQVHAAAWRSHLAASASKVTMVKVGKGYAA